MTITHKFPHVIVDQDLALRLDLLGRLQVDFFATVLSLIHSIVEGAVVVDEGYAPNQVVGAAPIICIKKVKKVFMTLNDQLYYNLKHIFHWNKGCKKKKRAVFIFGHNFHNN